MKEHYTILFGDAAEANILNDANIHDASHLLITIPDVKKAVTIIHAAQQINPRIQIIARVQFINEKRLLDELNVKYICSEVEELKAFASLTKELFGSI